MRPEIVGSAIVDLVCLLSSEFSVRVIGVSHVIPRGISYSHTLEVSQRAKILCNYKDSFGTFSLSFCWTRRDFFATQVKTTSPLVHQQWTWNFNTARGRRVRYWNFEFIVSERVQLNPDNSRATSALNYLLFKLNTLQKETPY